MNNYHNWDITLEEAYELALFVNESISANVFLKIWEYSEIVDFILKSPNYEVYNRNALEVYLEKQEERFIADNERVVPSPSGI